MPTELKIAECWEADRDTYYVRIDGQWLEVVKGWGAYIVEPEDADMKMYDMEMYMEYVLDDCQEIDKPPEWVYDELSASRLNVGGRW